MAEYTYYAFTVLNGLVGTELPLRGPQPTWTVNDPADLSGPTIRLGGLTPFQRAEIRANTVPWKCGIAVDRDGTIVWAGIVTARRYDSTSGSYALTVPGIMAYWRRRAITSNLIYEDAEQFEIVNDLLQLGTYTIPLTQDNAPSGVERDRTIAGSDLKMALDEILEIADNIGGYELAIDTSWDTAAATQAVKHRLRIASPRLGRTAAGGNELLLLEYPGNVRQYTWDEDGSEFANVVHGSSTTDEGVTVVRSGTNLTLLGQGFPQVDLVRTWSNISNIATLDGHVVTALGEAAGFLDAPTFVVPDSGDTSVGSWSVGDDVRIRITDSRRFPVTDGGLGPGLDVTVRIQSAVLDPVAGTIALSAFGFTEAVQ